ncbi:MAG: hypothetical protein ACREJX_14050, partial [Polyangiaceae bacterium]
MRFATATLTLVFLAACSHPKVSIHVTGWLYQRAGSAPSAAIVRLTNPSQSRLQLPLEGQSAGGTPLAGETPCTPRLDPMTTIIIACALPSDAKTILTDPLKLVAHDDRNREISASCAFLVVPRDGGFMNPDLRQWDKTDPNAPIGWLNSGGTRLGFLVRETFAGVSALQF